MEIFSPYSDGILMEIESEAKGQNHIVIKSKAIDLFRLYFFVLCFSLPRLRSTDFYSSECSSGKKSSLFRRLTQHEAFFSLLQFDDICITSSVVRIIFSLEGEGGGGEQKVFLICQM